MRGEERYLAVRNFNEADDTFIFLLSTRAGGVGLNLTAADCVIFYDTDWNPAMDKQAQDRCHRIGQMREVHLFRLIARHAVEENILKQALQKRMLDELILGKGQFDTSSFFKKIDVKSIIGKGKSQFKDLGGETDEKICVIDRDD